MESLDLTKAPPRSPWIQLCGIYNMPRTIDKLRALLPGGNVGEYSINGFSRRMLDAMGVSEETLRDVVAKARDESDVERWLVEHVDLEKYAEANTALAARTLGDSDREWFAGRYPVSAQMPASATLFDVLDADDRAAFAGG